MAQPAPPPGTRSFLVTATAPTGKRQSRLVHAASASEAIDVLTAGGYREIELHTDETMTHPEGPGIDLRPAERVAILAMTPANAWKVRLRLLWRRRKGLIVWPPVWMVLLAFLWYARGFRAWDLILAGLVLWLLFSVLRQVFGPDRTAIYPRVLQAAVDARWQDVLDALPSLERVLAPLPAGQRDLELARLRAQALARLGRSGDALACVRSLEDRPDVDRLRYLSVLGDTHSSARQFPEAEASYRQAVEAAPDSSTAWLQLAEFHVRHQGDVVAARDALACIDDRAITASTATGIRYVRGMIAIESREDREALEHLASVTGELERLAASNPPAQVVAAFANGYLAIAEARLGERTRAATRWESARVLIDRHAPDRLKRLGAGYFRTTPTSESAAPTMT